MIIDPKEFSKGMAKAGCGLLAGAAMTAVCVGASILLSKRNDEQPEDDDSNQSYDDGFDGLGAAMSYDEELKDQMSELARDKTDEIANDLCDNNMQDFVSVIYYLEGLTNDLKAAQLTGCLPGSVNKVIEQYNDATLVADKVSFFLENYYYIIHSWFSVVEALDENSRYEAISTGRLPDDFVYHLYLND